MKRTILFITIFLLSFLLLTSNAFTQHSAVANTTNNQNKRTEIGNSKSNKKTVSAKKDTKRKKTTRKKQKNIVREELNLEPDGEFIEYTVKKGDTIDKIAAKFNIDKKDILEANNIKENKKLSPNIVILIPKITSEEKQEDFVELSNKNIKPWKSNDEKYMLVKVAKSFIGAPYKYGGNSVRGLDCSAYVKKIYEIFDVELPRSAREQFQVGIKVKKEDLTVGDLVFFRTKRYIKYPTHVGIYIGDGYFIHSSSGNGRIGVKIDSLNSDFYSRTYVGATRVKKPFTEDNIDVKKHNTEEEINKS